MIRSISVSAVLAVVLLTGANAVAADKLNDLCDLKSNKFDIKLSSFDQNVTAANAAGGNAPGAPAPTGDKPKTSHPGNFPGNGKLSAPGPKGHPQV